MTFLKYAMAGAIVILTAQLAAAQQKFPLRSGEWETTTTASGQSATLLYCLNDDLWTKSLTQDPSCKVSQLVVTSSGASYHLDCDMKVFQMKSNIVMTFDGKEHMTAKGLTEITMNGKTTSTTSAVDYRWKSSTCSPNDMNLRSKPKTH